VPRFKNYSPRIFADDTDLKKYSRTGKAFLIRAYPRESAASFF